jgi:hypothetical protein
MAVWLSSVAVCNTSNDGPEQKMPAQARKVAVATFRALPSNLASFLLSLAESDMRASAMKVPTARLPYSLLVHLKHVVRLNVTDRYQYSSQCAVDVSSMSYG